jgi:hypothetical protein
MASIAWVPALTIGGASLLLARRTRNGAPVGLLAAA